jgi:putative membrane protein
VHDGPVTSESAGDDNASRWPRWVYGTGSEPDYRFSFANERTFLAWLRTSLALLAGGVAVDAIDLSIGDAWQRVLAAALIVLGVVCAAASWTRWARAERAMRNGDVLPSMSAGAVLTVALVAIAVILLALVL